MELRLEALLVPVGVNLIPLDAGIRGAGLPCFDVTGAGRRTQLVSQFFPRARLTSFVRPNLP